MLIVRSALLNNFKRIYGETDMVCCYARAQGFSAISQDAILLMNNEKIVILFISYFTNRLIQKVEFSKDDLIESQLKSGTLLADIWRFTAKGQKWFFRIQRKIIPLGNRQIEFLNFLKKI
ncbi:hypothetical protein [Enterococcus sp. AZ196]|uniref:hypothetical protein n=1 Tax=Enterococcus sp. AZ196 TaxID=2774659 RepID=UPI003D2A6B10